MDTYKDSLRGAQAATTYQKVRSRPTLFFRKKDHPLAPPQEKTSVLRRCPTWLPFRQSSATHNILEVTTTSKHIEVQTLTRVNTFTDQPTSHGNLGTYIASISLYLRTSQFLKFAQIKIPLKVHAHKPNAASTAIDTTLRNARRRKFASE